MTTAACCVLTTCPPNSLLKIPPKDSRQLHPLADARQPEGEGREQMGKAFPYPATRGLVLCPVSAVGRRSVTLGQERPSEAFPCSVQGSDTPLRWSLLLAFSALAFVGSRSSQLRTQPRTGPPDAQKLSTGANGRTYRGYAQWGCMGLESALMHSPLSRVVTAQKPQIGYRRLGLRSLWSTDSVGRSYTDKREP